MNEYRISTIGKQVEDESEAKVFIYKHKRYEQLLIWSELNRLLGKIKEKIIRCFF